MNVAEELKKIENRHANAIEKTPKNFEAFKEQIGANDWDNEETEQNLQVVLFAYEYLFVDMHVLLDKFANVTQHKPTMTAVEEFNHRYMYEGYKRSMIVDDVINDCKWDMIERGLITEKQAETIQNNPYQQLKHLQRIAKKFMREAMPLFADFNVDEIEVPW